jgi:hypothetical protein
MVFTGCCLISISIKHKKSYIYFPQGCNGPRSCTHVFFWSPMYFKFILFDSLDLKSSTHYIFFLTSLVRISYLWSEVTIIHILINLVALSLAIPRIQVYVEASDHLQKQSAWWNFQRVLCLYVSKKFYNELLAKCTACDSFYFRLGSNFIINFYV